MQENPIPQAFASLTLGPIIEHAALAVTPLIGDDEPACDYLTLDEALASRLADITEVSEAGSVPELRVRNRAAKPVLIIDGEELVGAKQNRVINLTVLVPAASDMTIPVSCVEAGRWHRDTAAFVASPRAHFASGRAEKMSQVSHSLAHSGTRGSDQHAVWDAISEKSSRMQAHSDTSAMAAIFDRHTRSVEEYVNALRGVDRQRGAIFSVHGRPAGVELFDRADVWRRLAPKLIRSYAIDAVDGPRRRRPAGASAPSSLLDVLAKAESRAFKAIGVGSDVRVGTDALVGAALVIDGRVVHLAAFASDGRRDRRTPRAIF